jgi:hypothetical protein
MNTGKNRVKGLKTELFKKKYQTNPVVNNPTNDIKGRDLSGLVVDYTKKFEEDLAKEQAFRKNYPLSLNPTKKYTLEEIAKMKENFAVSPENYQVPNAFGITGIPDLTAGQDVNDIRTQEQILSETENITSTPANIRAFQTEASQQELKQASKDAMGGEDPQKAKTDWRDYVRMGVGLTSATKGIYDDIQTRQDVNSRIQNLNDRPRYMPNEYEFMGRPGSQGVIYAKQGAEIRTGTSSGAEEAELERGEMFMLPNMDSYIVGGKRHSQGGEDFVLPEGTIVFSDHLKVPGLKNTFAAEAKKFDITKYKEVLENPHSKSVDRTTAEVMMDRNLKKLQQLFQIQQAMNGNSNGEMEPEAKRMAQKGMFFNPNPDEATGPTLINQVNQLVSNAKQNTGTVPMSTQQKQSFVNPAMFDGQQTAALAEAAKANPTKVLGAEEQPVTNTATNIVKQSTADPNTIGTVGKTNATDPNSIYRKKLPNGNTIYVENQGEFAGKLLADQYGNDPSNLLSNRYSEFEGELNPLFTDAFNSEVNRPELRIGSGRELIDVLSIGHNELTAIRNYYKGINREEKLFDVELDKGYNPDIQKQKAAERYKEWIESSQFADDVAKGKINPDALYFLKTKPTAYKDAQGVTRYKIDNPEVNLDTIEKYQAGYKAIASVKKAEAGKGKDKDRLKGFRVAPEGLADQIFLGMPISDDDRRAGNTHLGQVLGFEDDPRKPQKPIEPPAKAKEKGKEYNTKLEGASMGKYNPEGFDYPQLAPEIYGMASSQMFAYAPMDYNAPYLMPQTLNIQPQLQDVDNSYVAAINAGADPNSALIATLGAKQRVYSEKQNFDAQQRAAADEYNAKARWEEDVQDMQSLDNVYNNLIATADDAVSSQRQALIAAASNKRAVWKMEEARKQFWYNNFVRSFDYDPKTRSLVVKKDANKEMINQLSTDFGNNLAIPEVDSSSSTTTSNK